MAPRKRVFAKNLIGLGFLWPVSYIKPIPTHEKIFAVGKKKKWPECLVLSYFFLGWVGLGLGSFVGFTIRFTCFPTQQSLVNRKHPSLLHYSSTEIEEP